MHSPPHSAKRLFHRRSGRYFTTSILERESDRTTVTRLCRNKCSRYDCGKESRERKGDIHEDHRRNQPSRPSWTRVWDAWNNPADIKQWNTAQDDWHTTGSTVDLREGGKFLSRMEAKDGSEGFDFEGTYTRVVAAQAHRVPDGRRPGGPGRVRRARRTASW